MPISTASPFNLPGNPSSERSSLLSRPSGLGSDVDNNEIRDDSAAAADGDLEYGLDIDSDLSSSDLKDAIEAERVISTANLDRGENYDLVLQETSANIARAAPRMLSIDVFHWSIAHSYGHCY